MSKPTGDDEPSQTVTRRSARGYPESDASRRAISHRKPTTGWRKHYSLQIVPAQIRRNLIPVACRVEVWRGGLGGTYLLPTLSVAGASRFPPCFRFHTPLIEPDVQIYRIRLSEKTHAIAEAIACDAVCNFGKQQGSYQAHRQSPFRRRFLRPPSTEAPSFHRSYPASSVLRASPSSQSARPVSRELPVDPHCDHRWDFPCCVWSTLPACRRYYPGRSDGICSLVRFHQLRPSPKPGRVGSCISLFEACSAFTKVTACTLAKSPLRPSAPEASAVSLPPRLL